MFMHVIVGVDGAEGGRDAIALGRRLVGTGGHLTLAHIYPGDARTWRGSNPEYDVVQHERGQKLLESERALANLDARLRCAGSSSAGRGLHLLAEHDGADLLVVGSSRRSMLGRVLVGDDTHAALVGAPCAVAIAPAGSAAEPAALREIGVGYNSSPESEHALAVARELAADAGAKLSAFEAVSLPVYPFTGGPLPDADSVDEVVQAALARVSALDGVEPHAAYGDAAEELALYSASVDLLVVGSRDYGPVGRLVHGSTSGRLARHARCPLLVLTRAARAAQGTEPNGRATGVAAR